MFLAAKHKVKIVNGLKLDRKKARVNVSTSGGREESIGEMLKREKIEQYISFIMVASIFVALIVFRQ